MTPGVKRRPCCPRPELQLCERGEVFSAIPAWHPSQLLEGASSGIPAWHTSQIDPAHRVGVQGGLRRREHSTRQSLALAALLSASIVGAGWRR